MIGKDGYYSLRNILGYNCKVNIVLSSRGIGKSYGTKWFLMEQSGEFMCLYRNMGDMEHALATWLDDLCIKVPSGRKPWDKERFEWEKNKSNVQLLLDGQVKGYFRCISQVNHIKQETFPDTLNWIWWDEFIPLAYKRIAGVPSEGDALRAIIKTVDHDTAHDRESKGLKPLRVLMYANPFTWDNPVLSYFHVIPRGYGIWRVGPDIVCEMVKPMEKKKKRKQSMDDFLGDEVNQNQGWQSQDSYVEKCPKGAVPFLSIRVRDNYYGVYRNGKGPIRHVKRSREHLHGVKSLGSLNGLKEGETCLEKKTNNGVLGDIIQKMIFNGSYRYEDINVKFDFIRDLQGYKL